DAVPECAAEEAAAAPDIPVPGAPEPEALRHGKESENQHNADTDHGTVEVAPHEARKVDAPLEVRQQQPRSGVQKQRGGADDGDDDEDAAHQNRVNSEAGGDTRGNAAEPTGL